MARTTYFRASMILVAVMAAALVALLGAQKPAGAGIVVPGDLCLPPHCPPETTITSRPMEVETSSTATFVFRGSSYWSVPSFQCQLDGSAWSACTSPKEYTNLSDGTHTFQVRAIDSRSMDYSPASHTWTVYATQPPPPDTSPPRTTITNYPYSVINSTTARFDFTGADDRTTLADLMFECQLDGSAWSACTSPKEYTNLSDGAHTFQVRTRDLAGNVDLTPESRQFSVDTTPPDTTITVHPSDPSSDMFPSFEFSGSDNVWRFECRLLAAGSEGDNPGWSWCSSPYRFWSAIPGGTHTFEVRAVDNFNRADPTPASYTWTLAFPPETFIDSGPSGTVSSTTASFTFSSNKNDATFECKLDAGAFEGCESPKQYTGLSDGTHTFEVRAKNSAGTDPFPATRTWTVDTTVPSAPIITGPANNSFYTDGSFTVSGTAENGSTVELLEGASTIGTVTVDGSGNWSVTLSGVAQGEHTYTARAKDVASNTSGLSNRLKVTVDETAPMVDSTVPVLGARGVERTTNITATFSDEMNPTSLSTSVKLKQWNALKKRWQPVPAAVRVDGNTVTLDPYPTDPSRLLAANKRFKVTVATGATNLAGIPMSTSKSWTFTTGSS